VAAVAAVAAVAPVGAVVGVVAVVPDVGVVGLPPTNPDIASHTGAPFTRTAVTAAGVAGVGEQCEQHGGDGAAADDQEGLAERLAQVGVTARGVGDLDLRPDHREDDRGGHEARHGAGVAGGGGDGPGAAPVTSAPSGRHAAAFAGVGVDVDTAAREDFALVTGVGLAFFTASYMRYAPMPTRSMPIAATG
jgi:hypothetical protein